MKRLFMVLSAVSIFGVLVGEVYADRVFRYSTENAPLVTVTATSPDTVTIDRNGMEEVIPVDDVKQIVYDGEPSQFGTAREMMSNGQNEDARDLLRNVKDNILNSEFQKQERDYLLAMACVRIAYSGGDVSLRDAAGMLNTYLKKHTRSFHTYELTLLLGNIAVQMKNWKVAEGAFSTLAKSENMGYKARAYDGIGKVCIALGRGNDALKAYTEMRRIVTDSIEGELQAELLVACQLGQARADVANKNYEEAEKKCEEVLKKISRTDTVMNANAYNTLGSALEKQRGKAKDAMLAYMHTFLLYNTDPLTRFEALEKLIALAEKEGDTTRATQLRGYMHQ
ncbi:MAG: hypothetical protein Q4D38_06830 [Planctomycetia bacterium]|nr:hypothetical protein [Planctomycetia bacterium]